MPLNVTSKTNPNNPASQPPARQPMTLNAPTASTARAQALKTRLQNPGAVVQQGATNQPAPARPAGSSARAAQFSQQKSYPTTPAPASVAAPAAPAAPAAQPFSDVEPPPSGDPAMRAGAPVAPTTPPPATTGAEGQTAPAEVTSEPFNPQFAALARKERQIRKAQQDLRAAQEAWKQEQAKYVNRDQLASKPLETLSEVGVNYDRLVELQVAQANPDPNQALHDQIAALKNELLEVRGEFKTRDEVQRDQALRQMRSDVDLLVDSDPAYEAIKATESAAEVVDLIAKVFDEEGVVLSVEDAASQVEAKLQQRVYDQYKRFGELRYVKSKLAPPPSAPPAQAEEQGEAIPPQPTATQQAVQPQQMTTTLTNGGSATQTRKLSPRERAIARIRGEL